MALGARLSDPQEGPTGLQGIGSRRLKGAPRRPRRAYRGREDCPREPPKGPEDVRRRPSRPREAPSMPPRGPHEAPAEPARRPKLATPGYFPGSLMQPVSGSQKIRRLPKQPRQAGRNARKVRGEAPRGAKIGANRSEHQHAVATSAAALPAVPESGFHHDRGLAGEGRFDFPGIVVL